MVQIEQINYSINLESRQAISDVKQSAMFSMTLLPVHYLLYVVIIKTHVSCLKQKWCYFLVSVLMAYLSYLKVRQFPEVSGPMSNSNVIR